MHKRWKHKLNDNRSTILGEDVKSILQTKLATEITVAVDGAKL